MIVGIGTDIVEVERIQKILEKSFSEKFCEKVFTESEIAYCQKQANSFECYAARFAAKEAFLKALGTGLRYDFQFTHIDVQKNEEGKPFIVLSGTLKEYCEQKNIKKIHLSLTHIPKYAQAFVIVED